MARLGFNDGTGFVWLAPVFPSPGNRFREFTPDVRPVGESATALGTGVMSMWVFRTDYLATLTLDGISPRVYGGEAGTTRLQRFARWARLGGAFDVDVEDDAATAAIASTLAPGTDVTISLADPEARLYAVSLTVRNATTPYRAVYGGLQV